MAPNPRRVAARLDALYAKLPRIECKGLCSDACGPIGTTAAEEDRIRRASGVELDVVMTPRGPRCSMLDEMGRCTVYDDRPLICRLWGVTEGMPCTHGCLVEGEELLPDEAGFLLMAEAREISGDGVTARKVRALLADPVMRRGLLAHARRGQEVSFGCPACYKRIDSKFGSLTRCPHCGTIFMPEHVAD